ncbi:hypothetical protein [Flavobacterium mesophilum]|uniref:hypothetical protein n=1 Tax=Flavobacterium mesophilum TaxID=3143495 RepID=UPI0031D21873
MKQYLALNILALLLLVAVAGCGTSKPLKETIEKNTANYDSISNAETTTRNLEIIDSLKISLGKVKTEKKECDSVCQSAIERLLSQLNTSKKSGTNSYDLKYDQKDNSVNFNAKIGATESSSKKEYKYIGLIKTLYSHTDVPVEKPIPRWKQILLYIGLITIGYFIIKIIIFIRSKAV